MRVMRPTHFEQLPGDKPVRFQTSGEGTHGDSGSAAALRAIASNPEGANASTVIDWCAHLRCEVAGYVKDQLGLVAGIRIDRSVGGGHNRHVGSDRAVIGVQR